MYLLIYNFSYASINTRPILIKSGFLSIGLLVSKITRKKKTVLAFMDTKRIFNKLSYFGFLILYINRIFAISNEENQRKYFLPN